jgi:hypothetical protein
MEPARIIAASAAIPSFFMTFTVGFAVALAGISSEKNVGILLIH